LRYLGLPLGDPSKYRAIWNGVVEKMEKKKKKAGELEEDLLV
jgi:hypothetical protein